MADDIARLFRALGKEDDDTVVVSWTSASTPWKPASVKVKHADQLAAAMSDQKLNVYVTVNDVVLPGGNKRGGVADVTRLNALWADIDVKEGGVPSWEAATDLIDMLSDVLNTKPAAIVNSGHGLQPYWQVEDGEVSDTNRNYMVGLARRWGALVARFAEVAGGKVDSVFDLARVLRAPGTVNYKAEPVPATIEITEWSHPLSLQEIEEVLLGHGFVSEQNTVEDFSQIVAPIDSWPVAEQDCYWVETVAREIRSENPANRHPWLVGKAVTIACLARNGCLTEDTYAALQQALEQRFRDLLSHGDNIRIPADGEVLTAFRWATARVQAFSDAKVRDNLMYHHHSPSAVEDIPKDSSGSQPSGEPAQTSPPDGQRIGDEAFSYTDAANAMRLANFIQTSHIFVPGLGWHVWRDGCYQADEQSSIVQSAQAAVRKFADQYWMNKDAFKWSEKSLNKGFLTAAISLAESIPSVSVVTRQLDTNAYELCTPTGIVDLTTGLERPAVQGVDLNTRQTAYGPRGGVPERFMTFLHQIMMVEDDPWGQSKVDYLQRLFGMALIGEIRWQVMPMFAGVGANGKSALLEIIGSVLGGYTAIMPENFLLDTGKQEHPTEIMRLRGTRIAIASESRPDGKFNESRVKMLTGENTLSARSMRADFVDFKTTHSLFVALNHPPQVRAGGEGFWRRVRKVDFVYSVPEEQRDAALPGIIAEAEGGQILQWMIDGALEVQARGLQDPDVVVMTTKAYREEEDHLAAFIDEFCEIGESHVFVAGELYAQYAGWARMNGEDPTAKNALIRELRNRYALVESRTKAIRGWRGLGLKKQLSGQDWHNLGRSGE